MNGALVTFVNGEQTLHFAAQGSSERLAGQFDASYLTGGTGMYPYQIIVTAQYSTFNAQQIDSSTKLMVINERKSHIARGWTVSGLERLYIQSDSSALVTDGNGSGTYFASCGSGCFVSPTGDFSKLAGNPGVGYTRSYADSVRETFNTTGQMTTVVSTVPDTISFTYDSLGRLTEISDPYRTGFDDCFDCQNDYPHKFISLSYNSYGLAAIMDVCSLDDLLHNSPACRKTTVTVAADSTLQSIEDPDSISTAFRYNARRRLSSVIDRRGDSTRYVYRNDSSWKLDSLMLPAVPVDAGGGSTITKSPAFALGAWQTASVPMTGTSGSPAAPGSTSSPSDTITDPEGHATRSTVDRWGEALTITDALGGTTTITRDGVQPTAVVYPSGGVDSARYSNALPVWVRPAGADATTFLYGSGFGIPDSITGPNQVAERIFVDSHGKIARIRFSSADSDTIAYHRDALGRDTLIVDALGHVTRQHYDAASGNLDSVTFPNGGYSVDVFDALGRDSLSRAAGEPFTSYSYDAVNRLRQRYTLGQGDTILWSYDPLYLVRMRDAKGQVYRMRVDALGTVDTAFDPADTLGRFRSYRHNRDGSLTSWTNQRGQRVDRTYDALDRLVAKSGVNTTTDSLLYSSDRRIVVGANLVSRDSIFMAPSSWVDSVVTRFSDGKRYRYFYGHNSNLMLDSIRIASSTNITFPKQYFSYDARTKAIDTVRLELDTLSVSFDNVGLKETLKWGSGLTESLWYTGNGLLEFSLFNSALADSAFRREYDRDSIGRIASVATLDHNQLLVGGLWQSTSMSNTTTAAMR